MVLVDPPVSRKRFLLGLTALLAIIGAVVGTCLIYDAKTLSERELKSEVARELPPGSSQSEICAFLEQKGVKGTCEVDVYEEWWCCILRDAGVPVGTSVIGAIIHDTGPNTGLKMYFVLRPDGTLGRFLVEDFVESPL